MRLTALATDNEARLGICLCLLVAAVGACGIPQAYPCNKMSHWGKAYGVDHRTNPWPQIAWGLRYIDKRYGTPCRAWQKFKRGGGY